MPVALNLHNRSGQMGILILTLQGGNKKATRTTWLERARAKVMSSSIFCLASTTSWMLKTTL